MVAVRRQSDVALEDGALPQTPLKGHPKRHRVQDEAIGVRAQTPLEALFLDFPRRARRDALPEHTQYADTGCDVHPTCLSCPLVRCRYDEPGGARRLLSEGRDRQIVALRRSGEAINQIAGRFGVSRRTVFRVLARSLA